MMKTIAILVGAAACFGFLLYQAYLSFFVYTDDNPTRHDARILDQAGDGDAHAQYLMGGFLVTGRQGMEPDQAAAIRWFEAAVAQSYAPAQFRLGDIYRRGEGVEKNPAEARRLFGLAAEQGDLAARNALGELHFHGEGVEKSAEAALEQYRLAAEAGFAPAQRNMGFMAAGGHGMAQDYAAAMDWYRKAAEQTDAIAINNVGLMYEHGQGVEADPLRAWDCYFISSLWGYGGARKHRDRVEASLPAEWRNKGLYQRELRDCLSGAFKQRTPPVSRVRN